MGIMNHLNYLNPINYIPSQNAAQKKEIKASFMPKINREPKDKIFVKLSKNLTQYLIQFFNYKEVYELGKTNVFLMNNVIEYLETNETWPEEVRKLKSKYNFTIYQNEVDLTLNEAKINKRRYKFPQEEGQGINYLQFDIDGNRYISLASSFGFAHSNNEAYWRKEKVAGSYDEDQLSYYLINVCWLNTNFIFYHVNPDNNYKFYLNEYFIKRKRFDNKLTLTIKLGENKVVYHETFPSAQIYAQNSGPKDNAHLKEDFICYIKKKDFNDVEKDQNGDCVVKIEFYHVDLRWKSGWFIDGGSLVEITEEQLEKEEKKINDDNNINFRGFEEEDKKEEKK